MSGPRDDEGQISILVLGFTTILLMILLAVAAAASVHLAHKQLTQLADAAVGDAADALDRPTYYADPTGPHDAVPITDATVLASVQRIVASQPITGCTDVRVVSAVRVTERARVTLTCTAQPPFIASLMGVTGVRVPIQAVAQAAAPTRP